MSGSFTRDTLADKMLRFAIGAVLGATGGWFFVLQAASERGDAGQASIIVGSALLVGLLSMLLGNRFMEAFMRGQWWR